MDRTEQRDGADVLTAIRQRVSVRGYADRAVEPALLERLLALADGADHLTAAPPRVALVSGVEETGRIISHVVGSYGLILDPPHLLVGVLPRESERARLDLGYVLERVVLEATRLGLGTCWVSGTFDAGRAEDAVELSPGETVAAVSALGYPARRGWERLHSRGVRRLAGGHRRKPLAEIVFGGRWGQPWSAEEADPARVEILEGCRLAPSARNGQPWRFIVRPAYVGLALVQPAPIDAGIVMAHFALASAALGREGRWAVRLRDEALAREWGLPGEALPVGLFGPGDVSTR